MELLHYSKLLHFIGIGIIFASLLGGLILHAQYRKAPDSNSKLIILKALRPIGLLSPVAVVVLLLSGIGNMEGSMTYGWFTTAWLSTKIVLFIIVAVSGIVFGVRSRKRGKLVTQIAEGNAPEGAETILASMDNQQRFFYIVQTALILTILALSVIKPGQYGSLN
jgi:uncharacterized membrane protein SirB2